jgi:hypothetical protein
MGDDIGTGRGGRRLCRDRAGAQAGGPRRTADPDGRRCRHGTGRAEPRTCWSRRLAAAYALGRDRLYCHDGVAGRGPRPRVPGAVRAAARGGDQRDGGDARSACVVRRGADLGRTPGRPGRAGPGRDTGPLAPGRGPDLYRERQIPGLPRGPVTIASCGTSLGRAVARNASGPLPARGWHRGRRRAAAASADRNHG